MRRPAWPRSQSPPGPSLVIAVCLCLFVMPASAGAVDLTSELASGYDSNPALIDPSEGSGFSLYAFRAGQPLSLTEALALDLSVEGRYQDYWSVGDNYRLQADGSFTVALADGRFLPALVGEAAAYRDALIEADERDEAMAGIRADWILSKRVTLGLEQTCRWLRYRNWAMPFSGKGQGGMDGRNAKNSDHFSETPHSERGRSPFRPEVEPPMRRRSPLQTLYPPRDNRLLSTTLDLDAFLLPSLTGRVFVEYGDLDASLDMESYREIVGGIALSWFPAPEWLVEMDAAWQRTDYHDVPETLTHVRETNHVRSAGIQISRFWRGFEFFGHAGCKSGDAPLDYASYTQMVIQCGLSFSF